MRIYSKKTYIVVGKEGGAVIIGGEKLREGIERRPSDFALVDGDRVYEAQLFATAKERKEIYLVDAAGNRVEQPEMEG